MATEVSICSNALLLVGGKTITSLSDGSTYANLCSQFYAETRDDLLRRYPWKFATAYKTLAQDALFSASYEWAYGYVKPTDSVKIRSTSIDPEPWEVVGDWVCTNSEELSIKYTKRVTDSAKFDACFISALEAELAMKLCKPVTGSLSGQANMIAIRDAAIKEARLQSAFEKSDDSTSSDVLVDCR